MNKALSPFQDNSALTNPAVLCLSDNSSSLLSKLLVALNFPCISTILKYPFQSSSNLVKKSIGQSIGH